MAFIAQDNGGGDFKRVPPGVFIGRCYSLIDLGTQRIEYQGEVNLQHKIMVRWELFGEDDEGQPLTIEINGRTMPMTISKRYTLSLSTKARLRSDLEAWRGRKFTEEEVKGFDVAKLIGAYCMVNVTHNENNGKTYTNVASLTPLPTQLKAAKPTPVHPDQIFDLDKPDMALFETFHEKLQETIQQSPEWKERFPAQTGNSYQAAKNGGFVDANKQAAYAAQDDFEDGDVPF